MEQETIAVIGAGIMGQGVSFQLAKFNYKVILIDISTGKLEEARESIRNIARFDLLMQRQKKSPAGLSVDPAENIRYTVDLGEVANATLVVENIPEKIGLKEQLYEQLSTIVTPDTLVAVNTSATPVTRLSAFMKDPSKVLGIHFVNPVHLMPTVEMVKGFFTGEKTIERARQFLTTMHMEAVLVNDSPGFVSNRVMLMYINEAIFCVQEKVATARDVDKIFRECLSHSMGPLETADLIGLDTILYSIEVLYQEFNDDKYRPSYLLKQMVSARTLGKKTGEGFYKY
jgi:3-hydroxybutyryl-CoA dehydrogenase